MLKGQRSAWSFTYFSSLLGRFVVAAFETLKLDF